MLKLILLTVFPLMQSYLYHAEVQITMQMPMVGLYSLTSVK